MVIQAELIEQLRGRGYSVTPRQLADWRAKGLLPKLSQRGRGRGPGATYFWPQPDIADQAGTVCELLGRHSRTETALLGVWFAGYRVELHRVREAWLARLARHEASITREVGRHGEMEDLLGGWSSRVAKKQAASIGLPYRDLDGLFLETLNAVFKPDYRFVAEDNFGLIEIARRFLSPKAVLSPTPAHFSEESFPRAFAWIHENLSPVAIRKLISSASDDELVNAHRRWLACIRAVAWFSKATASREVANLQAFGKQLAIALGPCGVLILLYLARHGAGPMMDATIEVLDEFYDRVTDPSSWFGQIRDADGSADADNFP